MTNYVLQTPPAYIPQPFVAACVSPQVGQNTSPFGPCPTFNGPITFDLKDLKETVVLQQLSSPKFIAEKQDDESSLMCDEDELPAVSSKWLTVPKNSDFQLSIVPGPASAAEDVTAQQTLKTALDKDDERKEMFTNRLLVEAKYLPRHKVIKQHPFFLNETAINRFAEMFMILAEAGSQDIRMEEGIEASGAESSPFQIRDPTISSQKMSPPCYQFAWQLFLRFVEDDAAQTPHQLTGETAIAFLAVCLHTAIVQMDSLLRYPTFCPPAVLEPEVSILIMNTRTADVLREIHKYLCEIRQVQAKACPEDKVSVDTASVFQTSTAFVTYADTVYSALKWCLYPTPTIAEWLIQFRHYLSNEYTATDGSAVVIQFPLPHMHLCLDVSDALLFLPEAATYPPSIMALALLSKMSHLVNYYDFAVLVAIDALIKEELFPLLQINLKDWAVVCSVCESYITRFMKQAEYQVPVVSQVPILKTVVFSPKGIVPPSVRVQPVAA
jgi:hypothetical protein